LDQRELVDYKQKQTFHIDTRVNTENLQNAECSGREKRHSCEVSSTVQRHATHNFEYISGRMQAYHKTRTKSTNLQLIKY